MRIYRFLCWGWTPHFNILGSKKHVKQELPFCPHGHHLHPFCPHEPCKMQNSLGMFCNYACVSLAVHLSCFRGHKPQVTTQVTNRGHTLGGPSTASILPSRTTLACILAPHPSQQLRSYLRGVILWFRFSTVHPSFETCEVGAFLLLNQSTDID